MGLILYTELILSKDWTFSMHSSFHIFNRCILIDWEPLQMFHEIQHSIFSLTEKQTMINKKNHSFGIKGNHIIQLAETCMTENINQYVATHYFKKQLLFWYPCNLLFNKLCYDLLSAKHKISFVSLIQQIRSFNSSRTGPVTHICLWSIQSLLRADFSICVIGWGFCLPTLPFIL